MPGTELFLDRQLREILPPLNVELEGVFKETGVISSGTEGNPNLTRKLTDSFYDYFGKVMVATTVIGSGFLSYVTFNALGKLDNSFPDIAVKGVVLASSIVGGAAAGFMGGLIGGLGIALMSEQVEKVEDMIRRRFA